MRRAIVSFCLLTTSLVPFALAATPEEADEEIVVTGASRVAIRVDQSGSAVSVLTAGDLEARQTRFVSDVLREIPGVAINRSGPAGGTTQLRLRGAEGNHTLVVIDGIEVNEPFNGEFDFSGLMADDIERIEVIRGQQSALYGSDAIGGVVNIVTRRGNGPFNGAARLEGGSFGTFAGLARFGYGDDKVDVSGSYGYYDTDGTPTARTGAENDGYENQTLRFKADAELAKGFTISLAARAVNSKGETDPQDFTFGSPTQGFVIDGDDTYKEEARYWRAAANLDLFDGMWKQQLEVQGTNVERQSFSGGFESFSPKGERLKFGYQSSLFFGEGDRQQRLTFAFDHEKETYLNRPVGGFVSTANNERELTTNGYVLEYGGSFGALDLGAAVRHDENDGFDDATTWRATASYRISDWGTRLRARAGTGVKNPTNFELFGYDPGTFIGNAALKPEQSEGWEVGFDQAFLDGKALIAVTYFNSRLTDEITTLFTPSFESTPVNLATDSVQRGIEVELHAELTDQLSLTAAYTYLHARQDGVEEVRRPPNTASVNLTYAFAGDRGLIDLGVRYNGEMTDSEFIFATPADVVTLESFTLVNLSASYKIYDGVEIFARGENLLDEKYEEVFSYVGQGAAGYAGMKVSF
ncbi:Vitamin B12 transporter BtuB [Alphaproteobacteria bacterium SO-S41]|nr:Vitamin B12 transporter BtuB [Alphaproteobacteria bacterium SO-S41]